MPVKLWRFTLWRLLLGWSKNIHFSDCALLCFSSDRYLFWELYYKNVNIKKWFFNIDNQPPPLSNKWKSNLPCISKWGFDFVEKRPHHHSELSSTSSIIKVPPMHNVEAPPALFIQFHKKNWMNLPIFLHNGGTHTPHFQILRFEWCRFFWLLLLLGRSLRNKLLVPLASEQKWAKLERLHVTSKSWLYVRVTVENYANKLNYSSAYYQLSLTPMRLDGGKQKYAYHGKCMLCYIHRCD